MDEIKEQLKRLTQGPGVYLMKDADGVVIYVGKAVNLKRRVSSYFLKTRRDFKTATLSSKIASFDTIVTASEKEAIILEHIQVKKHNPRYNIQLKDGKLYPSLRISVNTAFPRIEVVRKVRKDGALYFGPYAAAGAARETLWLLKKTFPLRLCKGDNPPKRSRPCINFQMGRCLGPCCNKVDPALYREMVDQVVLFLKGRTDDLIVEVKRRMTEAAEAQDFERAAVLRDRMFALEKTVEKQSVVNPDFIDRDVFGLAMRPGLLMISILFVRGGVLTGSRNEPFTEIWGEAPEALASFISRYYGGEVFIPKEILVPVEMEGADSLSEWLSDGKGEKVAIHFPQRGEKARLLAMAKANADEALARHESGAEEEARLLVRLQKRLRMDRVPRRIECFDISHTGGVKTVASMVVFSGSRPEKSSYRRFNIRSVTGPDDYASMKEVITRRFTGREKDLVPDLVLVDGGRGQLSMAMAAVGELGISGGFALAGIAKKDEKRGETADKIYLPGQANPVIFGRDADLLLMLSRVRDEAHRFAITGHRKSRGAEIRRSVLDDITGIGEKRKKALLKHFGSVKRISAASAEDVARAPGMSPALAEAVLSALKKDGDKKQ